MIMGMTVIVFVGMSGLFGKLCKCVSERGVRVFDQLYTLSDLFDCDLDALGLEDLRNLLIAFQVIDVMINPMF
jgi:hypothetical protein